VPLAETAEAFLALQAGGLIRNQAVSNFDVGDMEELLSQPGGNEVQTGQVSTAPAAAAPRFELQCGHGRDLAGHGRLPAPTPRPAASRRHHGLFRSERLHAVAGIFAALPRCSPGRRAPVAALLFIVAMPVFYAVTAEGLKSRQIAGPEPQ
jgi:hypothetical protein